MPEAVDPDWYIESGILSLGFMVEIVWFRVQDLWFRVQVLGVNIWGLGSGVRVWVQG